MKSRPFLKRFIGLTLVLIVNALAGQDCVPRPDKCNSDECATGVSMALATDNKNVFCQGENVVMRLDPDKTTPFDSVFVYWCDGTSLQYGPNIFEFSHVFNVEEDKICSSKGSNYEITIVGKKYCSDGVSCRYISTPVTLNHEPRAKFTYAENICKSKKLTFNGTVSCNEDRYEWTFHDGSKDTLARPSFTYDLPGNYLVTLKVFNGCGMHEITQVVKVVDTPVSTFEISNTAADSVVCVGDFVTFIDRSNVWASNINLWEFPANNILRDTLSWKLIKNIRVLEKILPIDTINRLDTITFQVLRTGTYNFKLKATNDCGTSEQILPLRVVEAPNISLEAPPVFCETAVYKPKITVSGEVKGYEWTFEGGSPSQFSGKDPGDIRYALPGNYQVLLKVIAPCDTIVRTATVIVNSKMPAIITPTVPFCQSSSPDTLTASISGGTWSGNGIIDAGLGIFDPNGLSPGTSKIQYTTGPTGCRAVSEYEVTILASQMVDVKDTTFCIDNPESVLNVMPTGGLWSGPGIVNNNFNPFIGGVGKHDLTYELVDSNACVIRKKIEVTVDSMPLITVNDTSIICLSNEVVKLDELINFNSPEGGKVEYFIDGNFVDKNLNLNTFAEGQQRIVVQYQKNQCTVQDSGTIIFIRKPALLLNPDTTVCINVGLYSLMSNLSGNWTGPGVDESGIIDLNVAGVGLKKYLFIFQQNSSCELQGEVTINVEDPGIGLNAGLDEDICFGPTQTTFKGFSPLGGSWDGTGVQNPELGIIDLTQLQQDSMYEFKYCIEGSSLANCESCVSKFLTVRSLPRAQVEILGEPCQGDSIMVINKSTGFSASTMDFGDGTSTNLDSVIHIYQNTGQFDFKLQVSDDFGCENSITQQINIITKAEPDFELMNQEGCAPFTPMVINKSIGVNYTSSWHVNGEIYNDFNPIFSAIDQIDRDSLFIIRLEVKNNCGIEIIEKPILVHPYPIISFGVEEGEGCAPLILNFSNNSRGQVASFRWDFGNGIISNDSLPERQTFLMLNDSVTNYTVQLIGVNNCGTDTSYKSIKVYPPDVKAFIEVQRTSFCQYDTLKSLAYSTPGSINSWALLDPTGVIQNYNGDFMNAPLTKPGYYKLYLYASRCGMDIDSVLLEVKPAPNIAVDIPKIGCLFDTIKLLNNSEINTASFWEFGDGLASNDFSPSHVFQDTGNYMIKLTSFSALNNCPLTATNSIQIVGLPKVEFQADVKNGCEPLFVQFNNNSTAGLAYDWDFGNENSNIENPSFVFKIPGTYEVKLKVIDKNNCTADTIQTGFIVYPKPMINFNFQKVEICQNHDTIFTINETIGANTYLWTIDTLTSTEKNIQYIAKDAKEILVGLMAQSAFGCKAELQKAITVKETPKALFNQEIISGCAGLNVNFSSLSTGFSSLFWQFPGDNTDTRPETSFIFNQDGVFDIKLVASNTNGCPSDSSIQQMVIYPLPIADFEFAKEKECGVPMRVEFNNLTNDGQAYTWFQENKVIANTKNLEVNFDAPGEYQINLTVANQFNCKDTSSRIVSIYQQPEAEISFERDHCEQELLVFMNESKNAISYLWDFEGLGKSTDRIPQISFSNQGVYDIQFIAIFNDLCRDTLTYLDAIEIFEAPIADFNYESAFDNARLGEVRFDNLSENADQWFWNFGDGFFETIENPEHIYNINRPVEVTLTVSQSNLGRLSCVDSITKIIQPEWINTFFAPNAMSPEYGEPGVRSFKPVGLGLEAYEIAIYSPWGEKVWEDKTLTDKQPGASWDGTYKGELLPQGAYSWIANVVFESGIRKVYRGSVTILR